MEGQENQFKMNSVKSFKVNSGRVFQNFASAILAHAALSKGGLLIPCPSLLFLDLHGGQRGCRRSPARHAKARCLCLVFILLCIAYLILFTSRHIPLLLFCKCIWSHVNVWDGASFCNSLQSLAIDCTWRKPSS